MSINPHICTDSDCPNQICTAQITFRPVRVHGQVSKKKPPANAGGFLFWRLAVTYSHTGTPALPSAIHRFTAEFGMGSGGSNALLPPGKLLGTRVSSTPRNWGSVNSLCLTKILLTKSFLCGWCQNTEPKRECTQVHNRFGGVFWCRPRVNDEGKRVLVLYDQVTRAISTS